jgi:hypothetical protein
MSSLHYLCLIQCRCHGNSCSDILSENSMFIKGAVCVCVCVCVCSCICCMSSYVCASMWTELGVKCLPQLLSILFFETGSLTEPGAH